MFCRLTPWVVLGIDSKQWRQEDAGCESSSGSPAVMSKLGQNFKHHFEAVAQQECFATKAWSNAALKILTHVLLEIMFGHVIATIQ